MFAFVLLFFSLTPGMRYYYVFGDVYGWSEESSFRAAPVPGPGVTTRVLSIGGTAKLTFHPKLIIKLFTVAIIFLVN